AIRYAVSRRSLFERFLTDGRIELDSNIVERAIRVGSDGARIERRDEFSDNPRSHCPSGLHLKPKKQGSPPKSAAARTLAFAMVHALVRAPELIQMQPA
ncbi:IS66 family transposase, partial [Bradyrhizobium ottawaense]|uniref:IS66 family transposase n=1 Tax=Bradyrhizobium ottawaense TaxID=931866 RepID=UPI0030C67EF0